VFTAETINFFSDVEKIWFVNVIAAARFLAFSKIYPSYIGNLYDMTDIVYILQIMLQYMIADVIATIPKYACCIHVCSQLIFSVRAKWLQLVVLPNNKKSFWLFAISKCFCNFLPLWFQAWMHLVDDSLHYEQIFLQIRQEYCVNDVTRMRPPGPALAGAGPNARSRRGAPEQWLYDVIVFSQPYYDHCRAQM